MSGLLGFNTFINPNLTRICNPNTRYPFPHRTSTNLCLNNHHHCIINATHLSSSSNKALIFRRFSSMATASPSPSTEESKPFSVLFVCLGNICRSPAAEAVFRNLVEKRGLASKFRIDSAGTIGYHEGDKADPRMRAASKNRGIEVTSISRPIKPSDFRDFDLILAMDLQNREDIMNAYEKWRFKEPLPPDAPNKVKLMCSYCKTHSEREVPDPYYGGAKGFEKVLDLLEDACESLLDSIVRSQNTSTSAST
ncbi:hypothetical protein LUZ63_009040 [Rhynchospora breviuscula]|uniref:acid phosphatase n=1 Tax=Rhynchospora breviuscula TaxID=2022672 RepID=A0A9Q0CE95_9POAL|nr:hypothetical protein LUZ63_009040 [Rhynchospora breviuscula]